MSEVKYLDLVYYKIFNEFFICLLKEGICLFVEESDIIVYLVDGVIS